MATTATFAAVEVAAAAAVEASSSSSICSTDRLPRAVLPPEKRLIHDPAALLRTVLRLREANDNVTFRTEGGLRVMLRNEPDMGSSTSLVAFDVSVVTEDEDASIVTAINNEIDIMEDDSGCVVIEEYSFLVSDAEGLQAAVTFLNDVNLWTVCACGDYLIKDHPATLCYYCDMTHAGGAADVFCPICHEQGYPRWMVTTACCAQQMHKKCKAACQAASSASSGTCPMCRKAW